jgi:phosphoribosyl 1,2-cyclic phosphodiesterase
MRALLLGVRGSTPAPGAEFVRYGGHTSCIAVLPDASDDPGGDLPTLVLDAGTGLRTLTPVLGGRPFRGAVLLTHLHWDHVQGLPFFAAGDRPDAEVDLRIPAQDGRSGRDLLATLLSPPAFPITPEGLLGRWSFSALPPGRTRAGGFDVVAAEVAHKGGRTFGYRVEDAGSAFAFLPDHAPAAGCSDEVLALVDGVDVLMHDAQFLEHEREVADAYGHATVQDAVDLATRAGAGLLVLLHHAPARTDAALDAMAASVAAPMPVVVAREGSLVEVPDGLAVPQGVA